MTDHRITTLLALLDGATFANAIRRDGKPCRICLPGDLGSRESLVIAHLQGAPATLTFCAEGHPSWRGHVDTVALAGFCPAADGWCRWAAIDLDAADHGETGLADPMHATRAIAEAAANAGLHYGLLAARSRHGRGRHIFLMLPVPLSLHDAVIGVAALAAAAFKIAASDVTKYDAPHAFRRANGTIAQLGDSGAVELFPRATSKPAFGWALVLPASGAFTACGGGVIVDAFTDQPVELELVPRCDEFAWSLLIKEAKVALGNRMAPPTKMNRRSAGSTQFPIERIDERTQAFLDGRASEGARNNSAFAASTNLLGCGVEEGEAERLIMAGAAACGLPERESRAAFKSAVRTMQRKGCAQ